MTLITRRSAIVTAAAFAATPALGEQKRDDTYSQDELVPAISRFFGVTAAGRAGDAGSGEGELVPGGRTSLISIFESGTGGGAVGATGRGVDPASEVVCFGAGCWDDPGVGEGSAGRTGSIESDSTSTTTLSSRVILSRG